MQREGLGISLSKSRSEMVQPERRKGERAMTLSVNYLEEMKKVSKYCGGGGEGASGRLSLLSRPGLDSPQPSAVWSNNKQKHTRARAHMHSDTSQTA